MDDTRDGQGIRQRSPDAFEGWSEPSVLTLAEPTGSLQPALRRIREMAVLPNNWDSDGAVSPSAVAVAEACLLIDAVAEMEAARTGERRPPATSAPIADGGLQVEWAGSDARIDVQIAPDGTRGYMTKRGYGPQAEYDEQDGVSLDALLDAIGAVLTR